MPSTATSQGRWSEDAALLAPAALATGDAHDTLGYRAFRAFASSNVAGTLAIQQSPNGTNWYTTATSAVAANALAGTVLESLVVQSWIRARYTNGATIQASFEFDTALVA